MCNDPTKNRDTIELAVTIDGKRYHFTRHLPRVVRASSGCMSIRAGLEPVVVTMIHDIIDDMTREAAITLDQAMPHPRKAWWALDEAANDYDDEHQ